MPKNTFYFRVDGWIGNWVYQFRVGDIVTVRNWGKSYNYYPQAEMFFKNEETISYYANHPDETNGTIQFKIKGIAVHNRYYDRLLAYIEDREKRGIIMNMEGLRLVKQYPLRKGEELDVVVKVIK